MANDGSMETVIGRPTMLNSRARDATIPCRDATPLDPTATVDRGPASMPLMFTRFDARLQRPGARNGAPTKRGWGRPCR